MEADLTVLRTEANASPPSGAPSPAFGVTLELSGVQTLEYFQGQGNSPVTGSFPVKAVLMLGLPTLSGEENPWPEKVEFPFDYRKHYRLTIEEVQP